MCPCPRAPKPSRAEHIRFVVQVRLRCFASLSFRPLPVAETPMPDDLLSFSFFFFPPVSAARPRPALACTNAYFYSHNQRIPGNTPPIRAQRSCYSVGVGGLRIWPEPLRSARSLAYFTSRHAVVASPASCCCPGTLGFHFHLRARRGRPALPELGALKPRIAICRIAPCSPLLRSPRQHSTG